jgi:phosphoenolpyruvate-protein phosphotransferase
VRLSGVGVSSGRACAPLVVHRPAASRAPGAALLEDPEERLARFDAAVGRARLELEELAAGARARLGDDAAAIVGVQSAFLDDPEWGDPVRDRMRAGATPEDAVRDTSEALADALGSLDDPYLRERASDVRDLGARVLRALAPDAGRSLGEAIGEGEIILAAYDLTPTDTLLLDPDRVRGIVTEIGGRTSHTAILARGLGIPAVVGVSGLLGRASDGTLAAIDGDDGAVHLPPPADVEAAFRTADVRVKAPVRREPGATRDGVAIQVRGNAGSPADVRRAMEFGADGIGLYRTEMLFLAAARAPSEDEQEAVYREAAEAVDGRPITFRTLDIGGDKELPALGVAEEPNSFLGVRGVRLSLQRPALFTAQLRALARTAQRFENVRVMVPMVSLPSEMRQVRALAAEADLPSGALLGAMVEVPAAALGARALCEVADFLSVGTNDLTQYLLAADRTSPALGDLYQELHPVVLGVLASVADAATAAGRPIAICGELAAQPGAAVLLAGLGYRQLSVAPAVIPATKAALADVTIDDARALAQEALRADDAGAVAGLLLRGA